MAKKRYCTQNDGDCSTCSLVNYGLDCRNQPIKKTKELRRIEKERETYKLTVELKNRLKKEKKTLKWFAENNGLCYGSMKSAVTGKRNFTAEMIEKIKLYIGIIGTD